MTTPADFKLARRNKAELADPSQVDRLPPHSIEAEQGVLGCILLDPVECLPQCVQHQVTPGWFCDLRCREILHACYDIDDPKGTDLVTVQQRLRDTGKLQDAGGLSYLSSLPDEVPSAANLGYYLDILHEKYRLRRLIGSCMDTVARAYDHMGEIDDFLETTRQSFDVALRPATSDGGLPEPESAVGLVGVELVAPPELIAGICHKGTKLVLGGGSKSMKTWALMDMAISVAAGVPWLGFPTTPGRVLYVNLELPRWSFSHRLSSIASAKAIQIPPNLTVWNLRGKSAPFDVLLPRIARDARQKGYALIVIDPCYKLLGGLDENKAGDMTRLMNEFEELGVATDATVAFAAHFSKGNQAGKESIDRMSGSGVFARDPDSILAMTKHEEDDAFTVEATLRNLKPLPPFVIRWKYPLMCRDSTADPSKLKQAKGRPSAFTVQMVINALGERSLTADELRSEMGDGSPSRAKLFDLLKMAKTAGRLVSEAGKWRRSSESPESPITPFLDCVVPQSSIP